MTKTAEYINFEEGFLKEAEAHGCDVDFLRGYIKQADEIVEIWKEAFDELAEKSGDPLYKIKMANELMYLSMIGPDLVKRADLSQIVQSAPQQYQKFLGGMNNSGLGDMQSKLQGFFSNHESGMGGDIMKWLADTLHNNPNMLSSLLTGGAGGGLLGLLLGGAMGHPMMGMMMGGLGGAGAGAFMGNQNVMNKFNAPKPGAPTTTPGAAPLAPKPTPQPTPTPTPPVPTTPAPAKPIVPPTIK